MKKSKRTKPENWVQLIATYDYHSTLYADGGLSLKDGFIVRHFDENDVTVYASGTSMTIPYDNCPRIKRDGTEIALYRIIDDDNDDDDMDNSTLKNIPKHDEITSILKELESGNEDDDDDDVSETSDVDDDDDEHVEPINMNKFIETMRGNNAVINPKHAIPLIKVRTVYEFDPDKLVVGDAYRLIWHQMTLVFDKMFMRDDELDILVTSVEPDHIEAVYVSDDDTPQRFVLEPNMKFSLKTLWYDEDDDE
jgi:hypothetical protein